VGLELIALLLAVPAPTADADVRDLAAETFARGAAEADPVKARPLFRRSAELFEELRARGYENPALFRNLGNAWLRSGDVPRAIFAYRRGLALDPSDLELRRALAFARDKVRYPNETSFGRPLVDHRPPWLPYVGPTPLVLAGLTAWYALACVLLTRWWLRSDGRALLAGSAGLALALVAAAGLYLVVRHDRADEGRPLVVVTGGDLYLLRGNGPAYPRAYPTPVTSGVEARMRHRRGDWLQVELSGGEVGWVPASAVLVDRD
jgi:hypothetical protein